MPSCRGAGGGGIGAGGDDLPFNRRIPAVLFAEGSEMKTCGYCDVPYQHKWFARWRHECKQADLDAAWEKRRATLSIFIGTVVVSVQELEEMVNWIRKEMKK